VIAEDAALVRAGIARFLRDEGFVVVAEVDSFDALCAAVHSASPAVHLLVTDVRMPPTFTDEGLRAAAVLRRAQPGLGVLVLSQRVERSAAVTLFGERHVTGLGYLLKERVSDLDEFSAACHLVASGGSVVDPIVRDELFAHRRTTDAFAALTDREREVLRLMAAGASNRGIASTLFLSEKTVESHVRAVFQKLGLLEHPDENRRVAAVVRWLAASAD